MSEKLKKVIQVTKPVFKLADPKNPVHYSSSGSSAPAEAQILPNISFPNIDVDLPMSEKEILEFEDEDRETILKKMWRQRIEENDRIREAQKASGAVITDAERRLLESEAKLPKRLQELRDRGE